MSMFFTFCMFGMNKLDGIGVVLKKSETKSCFERLFALLFEKENLTLTSRNSVNCVVMTLGTCREK